MQPYEATCQLYLSTDGLLLTGILTDIAVARQPEEQAKKEFVENKDIRLNPDSISSVSPSRRVHGTALDANTHVLLTDISFPREPGQISVDLGA